MTELHVRITNTRINTLISPVRDGLAPIQSAELSDRTMLDLNMRIQLLEEEKQKLQRLVCYLLEKNETLRAKLSSSIDIRN